MQLRLKDNHKGNHKGNHKDRKDRPFIRLGILALLSLVLCGGIYLYGRNVADVREETAEAEEAAAVPAAITAPEETVALYDSVESGEVVSPEYGYTFINRGSDHPATDYPNDKRNVFQIIEVIPHDACSIFPYMVDWGSPEEYDKNVPIGFEGLMALAIGGSSNSSLMYPSGEVAGSSSSFFYSRVSRSIQQTSLSNYDFEFHNLKNGSADDNTGLWYPDSAATTDPLPVYSGYFEFVGDQKGLYYINRSAADGKNPAKLVTGIHHQTQAIPRDVAKGEPAGGEWYLDGPAYYQAIEHIGAARLNYNGQPILSSSGWNYDLSFTHDPTYGEYHADLDKVTDISTGPVGNAFDYILVVEDDQQWKAGFIFGKGGGYEIRDVVVNNVDGQYVRMNSTTQNDACTDPDIPANMIKGYFIYDPDGEIGVSTRFDLEFQETAAAGGGFYYPAQPDGWNDIDYSDYHFKYVGSGNGTHDVVFEYGPDTDTNNAYGGKVLTVSDNEGRYCLTSTVETASGSKLPAYVDNGLSLPKDYAAVITNIEFVNAATTTGRDSAAESGVRLGGADSPNGANIQTQYGGWVFVPVTDQSKMELTQLRKIYLNTTGTNSNQGVAIGTRIYVTNQSIRIRYYCRNGFKNNEWLKLLHLSTHPNNEEASYAQMIGGVGYDWNKTPLANLAMPAAKTIIDTFNQSTRIEIVQKSMAQLTPDDVNKNADLIYIANDSAIEAVDESTWNRINDFRRAAGQEEMTPWPSNMESSPGNASRFSLNGEDLRGDTLLALYDKCIYSREVALMMPIDSMIGPGANISAASPVKNYAKLAFMLRAFTDARDFKYFLPTLYPDIAKAEFTKINTDGSLTVSERSNGSGNFNSTWNTQTAKQIAYGTAWDIKYFKSTADAARDIPGLTPRSWLSAGNNIYNENDETFLVMGQTPSTSFGAAIRKGSGTSDLWTIIHKREVEEKYKLIIRPTNAEAVVSPDGSYKWVVYANEYDAKSFEVKYQIMEDIGMRVLSTNVTTTCDLVTSSAYSLTVSTGTGADGEREYTANARVGFALGGSPDILNPDVIRGTVTITASDGIGDPADAVTVDIIVRENFMLN